MSNNEQGHRRAGVDRNALEASAVVLIKWVTWHPMAIWAHASAIAALVLWIRRDARRFGGSTRWSAQRGLSAVTVALYVAGSP